MSINLTVPQATELKPRITVFGVGGAGGNAVNNMIDSGLEGVEFVVANTDAQSLTMSSAERRIQLGAAITQGLGAGSRPEVGCAAAEEALGEISESLEDSHMVFITAGMGGGTGTGGAPVIARTAREKGILTVGVVTKPFQFEGARRARLAEEGIKELSQFVDTLIIIPNQNLFRIANERTTFAEAFSMADEVLHSGVAGITDLMVKPGLINLDFADVRTVMNEMGKAMMGTGEAEGEKRAVEAAEAAISNPLLDEVSMKGARGVLINITGGMDLTLYEVDEAANRIRSEVDPDANIIVGSTFDSSLDGSMRVSVVATGIDVEQADLPVPETEKITMLRPGRRMSAEEISEEPQTGDAVAEARQVDVQEPAPVQAEAELALETPLPADFDPAAYEAEVVIPKQEPVTKPEPAQASLSADAEPNRPFIPAGLNRVEARSSELPSFLGARPEPVTRQAVPARGPSLFERLTGRSKAAPETRHAPVVPREAVQPAQTIAAPARPAPQAPQQAAVAESQPAAPVAQQAPAPQPKADDGMVASSFEEDQLEIPTFLRRQAN
ncbi:MAG: cell division protein FtsZ [Parvibaculum sp.]|nr:cell division protein FtsZ [Parvibaculum sp.]